eukprot:GHVL01044648.1.p1 GENE.GHVL01044648.1~~GHVL01044648.1.p1  ORF type:complete len:845 (+),score=91.68 GHVL01044648.1:63-2597(+)
MPYRFDIKKLLSGRSDRVKSVEFHPNEQWVLTALYSGHVYIWDYNTQALHKTIEVTTLPIRCARWIVRKQWIVTCSDDMKIRIYNYNTLEKIKEFEAHSDYMRCLAVHPTLSAILSCSDDMSIRLWDWDKDWQLLQTFESHSHYVMYIDWNPKDPLIFVSGSLDRSVKVWGISPTGSQSSNASQQTVSSPHFTLSGHEKGIYCVQFAPGVKPYLLSGSDDKTIRVWDYQTKQCIQVLSGHSSGVTSVVFHPELPIILSGSEDGTMRIWRSSTYRMEYTLNYLMERTWTIGILRGSNLIAMGYDEGVMVIRLGSEAPVASMSGGKIVWAKGSDIQTINLKQIDESSMVDGERLNITAKDMGACEIFPQAMNFHPSGRLFAVCGDGEYIVYTSQALRNKAFGSALDFAWSSEGHHYATINSNGSLSIFNDFKEQSSFKSSFPVEEIFGGKLLAVRSSEFVCFYDWSESRLIRKIDVVGCTSISWSERGDLVAIITPDVTYILKHDRDAVTAAILGGAQEDDDGIEIAFDLIQELGESVKSGLWVADSFIYVTAGLRLQACVAGQTETVAHLERPLHLLGYTPENSRLYLIDRELSVVSYTLHRALVEYQSAISRKDFETATARFTLIPEHLHNRVARFLEHQGYKEEALEVAQDADYKFELALQLGKLQQCLQLVRCLDEESGGSSIIKQRWKLLGDAALEQGKLDLSKACFTECEDINSLFLLYSSSGDSCGMRSVADMATKLKKFNIAFFSLFLLQDVQGCLSVLVSANQLPEATFFARTYCPSEVSRVLKLWKSDLGKVNPELADALADPHDRPDLFPEWEEWLNTQGSTDAETPGVSPGLSA